MADYTLSVIAPVYNEETGIQEFYRRLKATLLETNLSHEIIFVNDGSSDSSMSIMKKLRQADTQVKILDFSRNFGHQIAVKAGIDYARGEAVVVIDTDLQDPPEVIPDLIAKWKEGYDVVYAIRIKRQGESFFKKGTAALYYRIIRRIAHVDVPLDAGDFRLMARPVVDVLMTIGEKHPYIRGLVSWVGFRQIGIPIERQSRFAGESKYSFWKMLKLAWNGITHLSFLPLQVSTFVGIATSLVCFVWILQALTVRFILHSAVPGWTSLMIAVLFLGGIQLITLGILGSYLARNYDEARPRPLYIIRRKEGF